MRIAQVIIDDFRGIKKASVYIPQNCVILGANNSGKSTLTEALILLLGRDRWSQRISEYDFFGGDPTSSSRFNIVATITGFESSDPSVFPDWFNLERGGRPTWWLEASQQLSYELNPPPGGELAVQIGLSGRYEEDTCEFELRRYFFDGITDPFVIDPWIPFPRKLLDKLGVFFLPSSRYWERGLSFGSSQFIKLLRENEALPLSLLTAYKDELKNPNTKVEEKGEFKNILGNVENELQNFLLLSQTSNIVYRSTALTTDSILKSLSPHVKGEDASIIPFTNQGSGFISLQTFLILLEFIKQRKNSKSNTIFVAEEPELHLHPSLQSRLIQKMRAYSDQLIVTTHSPQIAAIFRPSEVMHIRNKSGNIDAQIIYTGDIRSSNLPNQVRQLYLREKSYFYEAILGQIVIVPEGKWDWQWIKLWTRVAETYINENDVPMEGNQLISPSALEVIHTNDSNVVGFLKEIKRFRDNTAVLLDGDSGGEAKKNELDELTDESKPRVVIQFGKDKEIEDLSAWILEPALKNPGQRLKALISNFEGAINYCGLGDLLKKCEKNGDRHKEDWQLHEDLAWEAAENSECCERAFKFMADITSICSGLEPHHLKWSQETLPKTKSKLFIAVFLEPNSQ
jgi:putative ATP-dependent endonuclease of OLD family